MSLTNDFRKVIERASQELFKKHPYGLQTVLGTQENLKNPSITNIKNYYSKWYVPNNMAICLSGDFDPENMLEVIKKYFGDMKPNPNLEYLKYEAEDEVEDVALSVVGGVIQLDGAGLDGDAALPLQLHGVQNLVGHLPLVDGVALLQQTVCQSGFAVVNMGDDGKISDMVQIGHSSALIS